MVHKRSQAALARAYIRESAFWDRQRSESVSQVSRDDVVEHLFVCFKGERLHQLIRDENTKRVKGISSKQPRKIVHHST